MKSGRTKKGKELLSFEDEETEEEPLPVKKPRLPPNPEVSPLNIPDYQKTLEESAIRTKLQVEYECLQEAIKGNENSVGRVANTDLYVLGRVFQPLFHYSPQSNYDRRVSSHCQRNSCEELSCTEKSTVGFTDVCQGGYDFAAFCVIL